MNVQTGIVNIRGREYQTVALRVQMFREAHPDHSLVTSICERTEDCVVMRAEILNPAGRRIATGHSEEYRKSSQINRTSALENAETSAIGRALAAFGIGGTEFASANEVQNAVHQQAAEGRSQQGAVSPPQPEREALTDEQLAYLETAIPAAKLTPAKFCTAMGITQVSKLPAHRFAEAKDRIDTRLAALAKQETMKEAINA